MFHTSGAGYPHVEARHRQRGVRDTRDLFLGHLHACCCDQAGLVTFHGLCENPHANRLGPFPTNYACLCLVRSNGWPRSPAPRCCAMEENSPWLVVLHLDCLVSRRCMTTTLTCCFQRGLRWCYWPASYALRSIVVRLALNFVYLLGAATTVVVPRLQPLRYEQPCQLCQEPSQPEGGSYHREDDVLVRHEQ